MADLAPYNKPLPAISQASRAFWEASINGRLALPHCLRCGHVWFPPSMRCPQCLSSDIDAQQASGRGRLWSWINMHRRYFKEFEPPYVVAFVELAEGPMLMSTIVGARPDELACDLPLEVVFEPATMEMSIPKFRPVVGAAAADSEDRKGR